MRILLLPVALLLGCGAPARIGPDGPLVASVAVSPVSAVAGDSVTVTVRVINTSAAPVTVRFPNTCILAYEIRNAAGRVAAPGIVCGQAITDHTFPPGTSEAAFGFVVGAPGFALGVGAWQVVGGAGNPLRLESDPVTLTINPAPDEGS